MLQLISVYQDFKHCTGKKASTSLYHKNPKKVVCAPSITHWLHPQSALLSIMLATVALGSVVLKVSTESSRTVPGGNIRFKQLVNDIIIRPVVIKLTGDKIQFLDIWVASWQNQQNDMCAQRRLRSDWADAQADLSLCWAHMPLC